MTVRTRQRFFLFGLTSILLSLFVLRVAVPQLTWAAVTPLGDLAAPTPTPPSNTASTTPTPTPNPFAASAPAFSNTGYTAKLNLHRPSRNASEILSKLIDYGYQPSCLTDKVYTLALEKAQNCDLFGACENWQAKGTLTIKPEDTSKLGLLYNGQSKTGFSDNPEDRFADVGAYSNTSVRATTNSAQAPGLEMLKTRPYDRLSDAHTRCIHAVQKMRNVRQMCQDGEVFSEIGKGCGINQPVGTSYDSISLINKLETDVPGNVCDQLFPVGKYDTSPSPIQELREAVLTVSPNIDMCVPVFVILVTDESGHNTWLDDLVKFFGFQPKTQIDYVETCVPTTLTNIGGGFPLPYNSTEKVAAAALLPIQYYNQWKTKEEESKALFHQKAASSLANFSGGPFGENPQCRMGDDGVLFGDCALDPTAHAIVALARAGLSEKCTESTTYQVGRYGKSDRVEDAKQIGSSLKAVNFGQDPTKNKAVTDLEFSFKDVREVDPAGPPPRSQVYVIAPYGGNNIGNSGVSGLVIEAMSKLLVSKSERDIMSDKYQGGSALFFNPPEDPDLPERTKSGAITGSDGKKQQVSSEVSTGVSNKGIPAQEGLGAAGAFLTNQANDFVTPVSFRKNIGPGTDPNKSYATEDFLLGNWSTARSIPGGTISTDPISCSKYDPVTIRMPPGATNTDRFRVVAQAAQAAADTHGVDAALLWGVMRIEGSRFLNAVGRGETSIACSSYTNRCGAVGIFQMLDKVCVPENNPCNLNPDSVDDPAARGLTADKMCQYPTALDEVARRLKVAEGYLRGLGVSEEDLPYKVGGSWYYGMSGVSKITNPHCAGEEAVSGCYASDGVTTLNYCECVVEYGKSIRKYGGSSSL